jgi:hypothetical protein
LSRSLFIACREGQRVQVAARNVLLPPQAPRHAGAEMVPEEVQPFPASPEVNYLGLVRVQPQPQAAEDPSHGLPGMAFTSHDDHRQVAADGEIRDRGAHLVNGQRVSLMAISLICSTRPTYRVSPLTRLVHRGVA